MIELSPDLLLRAYAAGLFPMAESAEDPDLFWIDPDPRGVLPLDRFDLGNALFVTVFLDFGGEPGAHYLKHLFGRYRFASQCEDVGAVMLT